MFTKFQTQRYVYETNISTKALAYKITFPEKKFFILSCILSVPLLHLRVIYNHLNFIKETEDKRKYLDDMYGIFEDIIDEDDIKLDPMVRDYTGYSLGEIGLIAYVEGTCGIYYRLQDAKVFGISFHDDNLPIYEDDFDNFMKIVEWWVNYIEEREGIRMEDWDNFSL